MDLDAPLDITIGPYETYNDELFGYKAAFEAYVNLRDDAGDRQAGSLRARICRRSRTICRSTRSIAIRRSARQAPIRVVNEVYAAGDGAHGVQTAAYNLPNDERVIARKGQQAGDAEERAGGQISSSTLMPISERVLAPDAQGDVDFDCVLHPHPGARAEPRDGAAPDHAARQAPPRRARS